MDRGQIPEKEYLSIKDDIQLIYMNTKYSFVVKRSGANSFTMALKGNLDQTVEADVRPLGDSGLLILMGGKSHVCYGNSTAAGLKIILDGMLRKKYFYDFLRIFFENFFGYKNL